MSRPTHAAPGRLRHPLVVRVDHVWPREGDDAFVARREAEDYRRQDQQKLPASRRHGLHHVLFLATLLVIVLTGVVLR